MNKPNRPVWSEHPYSRQATKQDLIDIYQALGFSLPAGYSSVSVITMRALLRSAAVSIAADLARTENLQRQLMLAHHELGEHSMCGGDCSREDIGF